VVDLTFYDVNGRPIAYSDDGRYVYAFSGLPLAYLDGDSVYSFNGQHLGWWDRGWVRDHQGAWVFFTDFARIGGQPMPRKSVLPAKGLRALPPPVPAFKQVKPVPVAGGSGWSMRSGVHFFPEH
jgi:hypothetical protein